jgi:hypothetical protein
MIQTKDAKVGNYIYKDSEVFQIEKGHQIDQLEIDRYRFIPIPITTDILIKAGFETDLVTYWKEYSINGQVLYFMIGHYKNSFKFLPTGQLDIQGIELYYWHKLQNLFYETTGQQLDYNFE